MALTNLSQITTSGISTLADVSLNSITGVDATFTGNVSIAGTLTYDDVTNIDSVGLITARNGLSITGGDLTLTDSIVHDSDADTKIRFPAADTITVETAGSERLRVTSDGDVNALTGHLQAQDFKLGLAADRYPIIQRAVQSSGSQYLSITGGSGYSEDSSSPHSLVDAREGAMIQLGAGDPTSDTYGGYIRYFAHGHTSPNSSGYGNAHVFYTRSGADTNTERLRITSDGDVRLAWNTGTFLGEYYDADYYMGLSFGASTRELYIDNRSNDTRADIVFRTIVGQSTPTEKLRIGSAGQIGLGGANYGTAGQVLTSGGSSANVTWTTPSSGGLSKLKVRQFTSNTTYTPTSGTTRFIVYATGGGGGSGGGTPTGGGGGGGTAIRAYNSTQMGSSASITIGGGGSGGSGNSNDWNLNNGSNGGNTIFNPGGTGATITGGGGSRSTGTGGGSGGSGSNGQANLTGMSGANTRNIIGSAGSQSTPAAGGSSHFQHIGHGGDGAYGTSTDNQDDTTYAGNAGNAGTAGIVIVYEYG